MQNNIVIGKSDDLALCCGNSGIQSRGPTLSALKDVPHTEACSFCEIPDHLNGVVLGVVVDNYEFPIETKRQRKAREAFKSRFQGCGAIVGTQNYANLLQCAVSSDSTLGSTHERDF